MKVKFLLVLKITMAKLLVSEQKKLRKVCYESSHRVWVGHTNGIIHEGLYLEVYPAYSTGEKGSTYKKCDSERIPLTRVYSF